MIIERQKYKTFPPAMWQPEEDISDPPAGYGFTPDSMPEKDIYFFHSDHLGSTSYLTDTAGNVTQFVWYSPYGESIIDEHTTSYENPFKFNGKEIDEITGLYYYGARYYDATIGMWYGVDPEFDIFVEYSPYAYCKNNPIIYIDPNGKAPWENKNIRAAKEYSEQVGGSVTTQYNINTGYTDAVVSYNDADGNTAIKVFEGNKGNDHNAVYNMLEVMDEALPFFQEGNYDPANTGAFKGKQEVADMCRKLSDMSEFVSDGADVVAVGCAVTGVGVPAGGVAKTVGSTAGYVADGLSLTADIIEGNKGKALKQFIGDIVSGIVSKKIKQKTNNDRKKIIVDVVIDKSCDSAVQNVNKNNQQSQSNQ